MSTHVLLRHEKVLPGSNPTLVRLRKKTVSPVQTRIRPTSVDPARTGSQLVSSNRRGIFLWNDHFAIFCLGESSKNDCTTTSTFSRHKCFACVFSWRYIFGHSSGLTKHSDKTAWRVVVGKPIRTDPTGSESANVHRWSDLERQTGLKCSDRSNLNFVQQLHNQESHAKFIRPFKLYHSNKQFDENQKSCLDHARTQWCPGQTGTIMRFQEDLFVRENLWKESRTLWLSYWRNPSRSSLRDAQSYRRTISARTSASNQKHLQACTNECVKLP